MFLLFLVVCWPLPSKDFCKSDILEEFTSVWSFLVEVKVFDWNVRLDRMVLYMPWMWWPLAWLVVLEPDPLRSIWLRVCIVSIFMSFLKLFTTFFGDMNYCCLESFTLFTYSSKFAIFKYCLWAARNPELALFYGDYLILVKFWIYWFKFFLLNDWVLFSGGFCWPLTIELFGLLIMYWGGVITV